MTTYRVLIADPLLGMGLQFPPGCRLVEQAEPGTVGTHWHLFEDPDAPPELEGRDVELTLTRAAGVASEDSAEPLGNGVPVITQRRVIKTHMVPPEGGAMPCCGRPPFEAPRGDRITEDKELVTCAGGADADD